MNVDRNGLEVLDKRASIELLRTVSVGRVLVTVGALPAAFPVNFALMGDDIVFCTGVGTKLDAAIRDTVVGFEVDEFDVAGHSGWSVLVTGHAREIADPLDEGVTRLALRSWLPAAPERYVRISSQLVTGRRLSLDGRAAHRQQVEQEATPSERPPWSGPAVAACRVCGSDRMLPVSDGESTNFVCENCASCWHVEQGWMYRVNPATCPGCRFKAECSRAYLAGVMHAERAGAR
jgi:nitroimidazol reductase NimA-like FMN-containing flavoprotein (pyridoxamine 5'-phosphate oxidase superfamily)